MRPRPERLLDYREYPILFVDDEPENLRVFELAFRREFHVATARSGEEALRLLHEFPTAVVLSDQRMTGISGVELLARIREIDPKTVRILVTAYGDAETLGQAINNGSIYRYVAKPWRSEEMRLTLRNAVEMYALDREREELLRELGILNRVSKALNSELQVESLLDLLLRTLTEELGYDGASVLLFDSRRERLKVARCAPSEGEVAERLAEIAIPCEQARDFVRRLDQGEIQCWSSDDLLELGTPVRRLATEIAAEEMLVVPLVGSAGAMAALAIDNRRGGRAFTSSDRTLLGGLAAQAAISLHNASLVEDLSRSRQRMLRADRMGTLGMLAAGLEKEIEGPLDSVHRFLQSAGDRRGEEAFWQQEHAHACRQLDQVREVVATASRLARGAGEEESPEVLEIGEVIEEALALLAPEAQAAGVALEAERGSALPNLFVRRDQLHQLILHALSRAVRRSSPEASVTLGVRSEATAEGEHLVLEVCHDADAGRAEEIHEVGGLREPSPSPGFGLMICHRMAAELGGSIEVQNPGDGAEVLRIRLPIERVRSS